MACDCETQEDNGCECQMLKAIRHNARMARDHNQAIMLMDMDLEMILDRIRVLEAEVSELKEELNEVESGRIFNARRINRIEDRLSNI